MTIPIEREEHWQALANQGLRTVIDPMVYRCGELFLKSATGVTDPVETWKLLDANILTIGMFFDALILEEKLPVFNYGDTFDSALNFDSTTLARINEMDRDDPVLFDVDVKYDPYAKVRSAAMVELRKLYQGPRRIETDLAQDIYDELTASEYRWNPNLLDLEAELASDVEKRLAKFFLGGLIFGGYAQLMNGEHVVQPKRTRLFLAAQLGMGMRSAGGRLEDALFRELKARTNAPSEDLPWRPTFFPYLLSRSRSPMQVLHEAIVLRHSPEVKDYRKWLLEVLKDWKQHGRIMVEKEQDVRAIAQSVDRKLGVIPSAPKVELKFTITDVAAHRPPGALDFMPAIQGIWGWFLDSLPGNRYRKLLTRAIVADHEYRALTNSVGTIWRV